MGSLASIQQQQNNKRPMTAELSGAGVDDKPLPAKKAPKRSLAATIERMEKHKILERKRREKTKGLVSELQGLIPSFETVPEGLTMNTVLEEAIEHLKAQHAKNADSGSAADHSARKAGGDAGEGDSEVKTEGAAGAGGLARAFGPSGSDTRDVFNLIQNQIEDMPQIEGMGAMVPAERGGGAGDGKDAELEPRGSGSGGEQTTVTLALEKKSVATSDTLQLGRLPDQEFKYFRLVLMQETLYARMLENWEKRMGVELVRESLSLLRTARQGLSKEELEEMLRIQERGLGQQWKDLAEALHADIKVKSEGLLGFVYSAFRLAVERRYLRNPEDLRRIQLQLAEYFEKKHSAMNAAGEQSVITKEGTATKRAANELPYVLESVGEWARLRKCLSSSLDMLYQLYNDKDKGDLLRFWRQGDNLVDESGAGVGYEAATKCYVERLQRFEQEGMAPQILWQSCLMVARFLGDAGEFEEAETILGKARDLSKELGGGYKFVAEVSLRCAELLNKWAASTPEYSPEIMVRSATYAKQASDIFAYMTDDASKRDYGTALYWMGLNFGTLCRIGGGGTWSADQAHEIAEQALEKCSVIRSEANEPEGKIIEILFGQAVLAFCKAEAMRKGFIQPAVQGQGGSATSAEDATRQLLELAEPMFRQCYVRYSNLYSANHLEAIKCITMLGLVYRKLQRFREAHDWCRKEVKVREEVQGELHPRTQQARRVYTELVERIRTAAKTGKSSDSQDGGGSVAAVSTEGEVSGRKEVAEDTGRDTGHVTSKQDGAPKNTKEGGAQSGVKSGEPPKVGKEGGGPKEEKEGGAAQEAGSSKAAEAGDGKASTNADAAPVKVEDQSK
eukprot:Tamp_05529.p1 GENE.Tamp_05529~~Tamp_05529.p1  ORF type:complete len:935 (-),score=201.39 Tamp_05529:142-2685(-)